MKSVITTVIGAADSASRFPSASDMESAGFHPCAAARLEAAEKLVGNYDAIAQRAVTLCTASTPTAPPAVSPASAPLRAKRSASASSLPASHQLLPGHRRHRPLDELAINGQKEVYKALSIDAGTYVAGFSNMRNDGCAPRDMSPQALTAYNTLLDYVINSLG